MFLTIFSRERGLFIFIISYCLYIYLNKFWVTIILQHEVQSYNTAFNILNQFSMLVLCIFLFFTSRQCRVFNSYLQMSALTGTSLRFVNDDPAFVILIHKDLMTSHSWPRIKLNSLIPKLYQAHQQTRNRLVWDISKISVLVESKIFL